jgi:hypothetical protein
MMNGKRMFVRRIMIWLIPSNPRANRIPIKLIQFVANSLDVPEKTKGKVIIKFRMEAASATYRIIDSFLKKNRNRPERNGMIRRYSNIIGSDCQDENDK